MANGRVAIVGCGYVGTAVGAALALDDYDCIGTSTNGARQNEIESRGIRSVVVQLSDTDRLREILRDRETVVLAVAPTGSRSDYRNVYLHGATHLLRAINDSRVRHIIYTSSTRVYGQQNGQWVDESSPTVPESENGRILVETERRLIKGGRTLGIAVTVIRLSGIYGPGRNPENRIQQFAGSERPDGDVFVNMIHRDDIVAAIRSCVVRPLNNVFNLSDDVPTTRREFYNRVIGRAGLNPIHWKPSESPQRGKRVRNTHFKKTFGLELRHPRHC